MIWLLPLLVLSPSVLASYKDFGIPPSNSVVSIRVFNAAQPGDLDCPAPGFMSPLIPGYERIDFPMYAFLLEHYASGTLFMWDLGTRPNVETLAPSIVHKFEEGIYSLSISVPDVTTRLVEAGIDLNDIDSVFWSHSHFDHIGDMSKFPNTTGLVVGADTDLSTYPDNSQAILTASDLAGRNVSTVDFTNSTYRFAGLRAVDYFLDGSFYVLDTPGHLKGHIAALVRVTPESFVLLTGDAFHHAGQLRPTHELLKEYPVPENIVSASRHNVSTAFFWSPNSTLGEFDVSSRSKSFFDHGNDAYMDPQLSRLTADKLQLFDADRDFMVIGAHDWSISNTLKYYPDPVNDWKEDGMKERGLWSFLEFGNPAYRFKPKA